MPRRNRDPRHAAYLQRQRRRQLDRRDQHEERPPTPQQLARELVRAGKASPLILGFLPAWSAHTAEEGQR